jgi:DNA-binding transcriptional regulator YiaG
MFKAIPRYRKRETKARLKPRKRFMPITPADLKKRRLALGFDTQRKFAEALGIARPTLRGWEQGQKRIPLWAMKFLECLEQNEKLRQDLSRRSSL